MMGTMLRFLNAGFGYGGYQSSGPLAHCGEFRDLSQCLPLAEDRVMWS